MSKSAQSAGMWFNVLYFSLIMVHGYNMTARITEYIVLDSKIPEF